MKKFIHVFYDIIMGNFVKILGIIMLLSTLLQIFMRYMPTNPFQWTEELARLTFVWFCFMGASIALIKKMHLGVDYFYNKMSARAKIILDYITWILLLGFSVVITYNGILLVKITYIQKSPYMSLPLSYFYASVPAAGGLFAIYSLIVLAEMVMRSLQKGINYSVNS